MVSRTPEQIKNCRRALCLTLGPYAFVMPDEEVNKLMGKLQERVNKEGGVENGRCE